MQMILVRGLPGSGKSTIAKALKNAGFAWYEADMYFMDVQGEYLFNPAKVKDAHLWCQHSARLALKCGENVVVSNTFAQMWEIIPYFKIAREFGIEPNVIEAKGSWNSIHSVPPDVINRMIARWEPFSVNETWSE